MKSCRAYGPTESSVDWIRSPSLVGTSSGLISWSRISSRVVVDLALELARRDDPPDEVLHQGLRDAGVDAVVRHLVADAVGAPAERELGQVAGADDDAAALVGGAEQVVGAQPGLDVLEGHVVDLLAAPERVAEVREHLGRGGADVELLPRDARATP